jgi:hypothetical protein
MLGYYVVDIPLIRYRSHASLICIGVDQRQDYSMHNYMSCFMYCPLSLPQRNLAF